MALIKLHSSGNFGSTAKSEKRTAQRYWTFPPYSSLLWLLLSLHLLLHNILPQQPPQRHIIQHQQISFPTLMGLMLLVSPSYYRDGWPTP